MAHRCQRSGPSHAAPLVSALSPAFSKRWIRLGLRTCCSRSCRDRWLKASPSPARSASACRTSRTATAVSYSRGFLLTARLLLDRRDNLGPLPAESLGVQVLNELGKRLLPGLLTVVVELAELPGVQAELTRHLNMGMRQPVPSARVCPDLQLRREDRCGQEPASEKVLPGCLESLCKGQRPVPRRRNSRRWPPRQARRVQPYSACSRHEVNGSPSARRAAVLSACWKRSSSRGPYCKGPT